MKKTLCALVSLWMCLCLCVGGFAEAATDTHVYTLPEKLARQVSVGSGFAGTLTLSLLRQAGRQDGVETTQPWVFDLSYINLWEGSAILAEKRFSLSFMDGDQARMYTDLSMRDGRYYAKSSLFGDSWYLLPRPDMEDAQLLGEGQGAGENPSEGASPLKALVEPISRLVSQSAMPSLLSFAIPALLGFQSQSGEDLDEAFSAYTTKIDLWIEAYRQNAALGKLADGTTTMQTQYEIPATAIKSQLKQMLMDVLGDEALLARLKEMLPAEYGELLLSPLSQPFYFFAIDELPLEGAMTISRTVSLTGETLELHITLPLYDQTAGTVTLSYDRKAGAKDDLPDENVIALESKDLSLRLEYQGYSTMTGVRVYQGTILREPRKESTAGELPILSAAFTLSHEEITETDEANMESLTNRYKLSLEPELSKEDAQGKAMPLSQAEKEDYFSFPAFDLETSVTFKSKQESTSPTYMEATVSLTGDELPQTLEATFSGRTCAAWFTETVNPKAAVDLAGMSTGELATFLAQASLKTGACFLPFLSFEQEAEAPDDATSAEGAEATAAPTAEEFPTLAPDETQEDGQALTDDEVMTLDPVAGEAAEEDAEEEEADAEETIAPDSSAASPEPS